MSIANCGDTALALVHPSVQARPRARFVGKPMVLPIILGCMEEIFTDAMLFTETDIDALKALEHEAFMTVLPLAKPVTTLFCEFIVATTELDDDRLHADDPAIIMLLPCQLVPLNWAVVTIRSRLHVFVEAICAMVADVKAGPGPVQFRYAESVMPMDCVIVMVMFCDASLA